MKVGASYYPEVTPAVEWDRDLDTGRKLGLSALRCGEFAWSALFSPTGEPTWDWAHRFLDLAHHHGYEVVWCTPTATPPPYIFDRWPDLPATTFDGMAMTPGVRRNYCPSHPGYLDLCTEIAARLAKEFSAKPAIVGWQVDNELAGDGFTCWCDRCGKTFQRWLERRHGSLDRLNAAWQTSVWSQVYTRWEQIPVPLRFRPSHAPALKLAWRRFRSDCWLEFYRRQADALRAGGARSVTTNFYNLTWDVCFDRWKWRSQLDSIGISHYAEHPAEHAFELALLQGPRPGEKPLWVLEQKAGQQASQNLLPDDPHRLDRHIDGCARAGAAYGIYWHLRQHAAGCEMEHGAVLRHDGRPTRIGAAIAAAIANSAAKPAEFSSPGRLLVFSFHQFWANETRPPMGAPFDYRIEVQENWFAAAQRRHGNIRIGNYTDIGDESLILAPFFQLTEPGAEERFRAAVENGATLVTTVDFLRLDDDNNVRRIAPLASLAAWATVPDLELYQLKDGTRVTGTLAGKAVGGKTFWAVPLPGAVLSEKWRPHGEGTCEGVAGPLLLEGRVGKGRVIVALAALDLAGVEAALQIP